MRISVLVINYNGERHLAQLVAALQAQTLRDFELIFIDNGSADGSVALMQQICDKGALASTLLINRENTGFAPACNQGIRAAQGEWIALLNNDAFPEPGWLEHLWAAAQSSPRLGMVAAKLLFAHQPERINSAGIAIDRAGIAWDWRGGELDKPEESGPVEIFGPCGGAALYSRQMLDEIGGFDEDFFAYLEDVDLAWRAQRTHWRCVYAPAAVVRHVTSATAGEGSRFKSRMLGRNKVWLAAKNSRWRDLPIAAGYDLAAVLYALVFRRDLGPMLGRLDALSELPAALRARPGTGAPARGLSPLVAPWQVPRRMG